MISITEDSSFDLKPMNLKEAMDDVEMLLLKSEKIVAAFRAVRDKLIFTNKRIISVDVQGLFGKRKAYTSIPYSKIHIFTIQTPGLEMVPDCELILHLVTGKRIKFEFKGSVDIGKIGRVISEYIL